MMRGGISIIIIYFISTILLSIQCMQLMLEDPFYQLEVVILRHNNATKNVCVNKECSEYNSEQVPDVSLHPSIHPEHSSSEFINELSTSIPTRPSILPLPS